MTAFATALPAMTAHGSEITVTPGEMQYIQFNLLVPPDGYVYANPKGPGIGKPLSLEITGIPAQSLPVMISVPEKDTSFGPDFVWIYKNDTRICIPVNVRENSVLTVTAKGLFCSKSGRCTPFVSSLSVRLIIVKDAKSSVSTEGLIPFGNEPSGANQPMKSESSALADIVFSPVYLSGSVTNIAYAVLFGLLAGFILNFMPCVFPVLSIKLFGFVASDRNNTARKTGLAYVAGIITSFILLASLTAAVRSGWGSLFQNNTFIILTVFVLFIMALSFLGVFSLNIPGFAGKYASRSYKHEFTDSFIKGSLAALLATPCSGPFLGATLAWTMSKPPAVIFTVFIAIGVGMSLPYAILIIKPSVLSILPKPGRWMIILEKMLGLLLIGSVAYFIQILPQERIIPVVIMLFIGALALWQYGKWGNPARSARSRIISTSITILLCVSAIAFALRDFKSTVSAQSHKVPSFSIQKLRNESKTAITAVVFTADWCPNCKLVEHAVLNNFETVSTFRKERIIVMTADITREGTEGEALLHKLGSSSIPFLAIFPKGDGFKSPVCLRDIYTVAGVKEAVEKVKEINNR